MKKKTNLNYYKKNVIFDYIAFNQGYLQLDESTQTNNLMATNGISSHEGKII